MRRSCLKGFKGSVNRLPWPIFKGQRWTKRRTLVTLFRGCSFWSLIAKHREERLLCSACSCKTQSWCYYTYQRTCDRPWGLPSWLYASSSHSWSLGCFCRSERLQHSLPQSNTSTACWSCQQALEEASGKAVQLHLQGRRWFWGRKWVFSKFTPLWDNFGYSGHCWWCFGTRTSSIQEFLWCTQAESHCFVMQKSNNPLLHKTTDGNAPCWVFWSLQGSFL